MNIKPVTTLFMLMSLDGKISTGSTDDRDIDRDLPLMEGVNQGLSQYYQLEQATDLFSFNTGRVMAKVGWNEVKENIQKTPVSFVIVDNKPHLSELGINNLLARLKKLIIVTTNDRHPANLIISDNLKIIKYNDKIDFSDLFQKLKSADVDEMTIQSGGTMNAELIRRGLVDYASIVVAPVLIGGKNTSTLVDGAGIESFDDLCQIKPLELISADKLNDSYVHLKYRVVNDVC